MTTQPEVMPHDTTSEVDSLRHQLLQAQRLSSVGELASSVAHEFNNILTTIINYARLGARASMPTGPPQFFRISSKKA